VLHELVFGSARGKLGEASTDRGSRRGPGTEQEHGELALITVKETAKLLGLCSATVYAMVERGEIAHVRLRNKIQVVVRARARY
jgi:excisionase family DNA binding protein